MEFLTFHAVNPIGGSPAATVVVAPDAPPPPPAAPGTTVPNIDELWKATPRAKRAELAVGLIDEMELQLRGR